MKVVNREEERLCYNENYCEGRSCGECEYHWSNDEEINEEREEN